MQMLHPTLFYDQSADYKVMPIGASDATNGVNEYGRAFTGGYGRFDINNTSTGPNLAAGQTRTGRRYMTVKFADGTTQTIYSGTWFELNTPAA